MKFDSRDTICAISSPPGTSNRAVVRLSGENSLEIISSLTGKPTSFFSHQSYNEVEIPLPCCKIKAQVLTMLAPRSYTGENTIEINLAGSPILANLLLEELLTLGARLAGPGEFTRIAFENGKLDINQAQGVLDLIHSQDENARRASLYALSGNLSQEISSAREKLLDVLFRLEANLDFAEEDISIIPFDELNQKVFEIRSYLDSVLSNTTSSGNAAPLVVIAGRVNSGKSTLFNLLSSTSALVSEIPGTTRDALKERMELNGIQFELWDTAGFGSQGGEIDKEAERIAQNLVNLADVVIYILSKGDKGYWKELSASLQPRKTIVVLGKADSAANDSLSNELKELSKICRASGFQTPVAVSSVTNQGIPELLCSITEQVSASSHGGRTFLSAWQREAIFNSLKELNEAHGTINERMPQEITALFLRNALDAMDILQGSHITDELLDRIFSSFCIGK